jgi:hypothetical protein
VQTSDSSTKAEIFFLERDDRLEEVSFPSQEFSGLWGGNSMVPELAFMALAGLRE